MTLPGFPATTDQSGTSLVTIDPAAMVQPFPMVTPARMDTFPPIQDSSPIETGKARSQPSSLSVTETE